MHLPTVDQTPDPERGGVPRGNVAERRRFALASAERGIRGIVPADGSLAFETRRLTHFRRSHSRASPSTERRHPGR